MNYSHGVLMCAMEYEYVHWSMNVSVPYRLNVCNGV